MQEDCHKKRISLLQESLLREGFAHQFAAAAQHAPHGPPVFPGFGLSMYGGASHLSPHTLGKDRSSEQLQPDNSSPNSKFIWHEFPPLVKLLSWQEINSMWTKSHKNDNCSIKQFAFKRLLFYNYVVI